MSGTVGNIFKVNFKQNYEHDHNNYISRLENMSESKQLLNIYLNMNVSETIVVY